jgi:hypothetical protein
VTTETYNPGTSRMHIVAVETVDANWDPSKLSTFHLEMHRVGFRKDVVWAEAPLKLTPQEWVASEALIAIGNNQLLQQKVVDCLKVSRITEGRVAISVSGRLQWLGGQ